MGRGAAVQQQVVTRAQQIRYQLFRNIVLRVDEGGVDFRDELHHLVADEEDGVLLLGVPAACQHLGGARHIVFVTVDHGLAAQSRPQQVQHLLVHGAHGDGVFHDDVVRHADVEVRIGADFPDTAAGGDALLHLKRVIVLPVSVRAARKTVGQRDVVVRRINGAGSRASCWCSTGPCTRVVVRAVTYIKTQIQSACDGVVGRIAVAELRAALDE